MIFKDRNLRIIFGVVVLTLCVSGCDLISSIKEYFQEPEKKPSVQLASVPQNSQKELVAPEAKPGLAPMNANTLARVGNWSITAEEFEERLNALKEVVPEYDITDPEARRLVLDELINQEVLVQGAEAQGLTRQKDIQAAVEEFRRTLIVREVARQLTENIEVSDMDARAFYNENKDAMVGPAQWHVREIVTNTKDEANDVLAEVLKGADFAQMARQYSIGKTADQGGDLGFITQEPFPQMGTALLPLEIGDVSSVFQGPDGYYIVKLEEKKGGAPISFDEIKDDIIQSQTLLAQQQAILDYLDSLKAKTKIDINEQLLQP